MLLPETGQMCDSHCVTTQMTLTSDVGNEAFSCHCSTPSAISWELMWPLISLHSTGLYGTKLISSQISFDLAVIEDKELK